jgi:hypothetical protein
MLVNFAFYSNFLCTCDPAQEVNDRKRKWLPLFRLTALRLFTMENSPKGSKRYLWQLLTNLKTD